MILDDFVMLGTTVAEPMSDGRVAVCSAGYSPELRKLVRIYPLGMADAPHRWSQNRIELERNNRDSRDESWTIKGDRHRRDINQKFECIEKHVSAPTLAPQLNKHLVGSTHEADERRLSLALLRPQNARIVWRSNEAHHDHEQGDRSPGCPTTPSSDTPHSHTCRASSSTTTPPSKGFAGCLCVSVGASSTCGHTPISGVT